jgi:predicted nucleic acid-binding protein
MCTIKGLGMRFIFFIFFILCLSLQAVPRIYNSFGSEIEQQAKECRSYVDNPAFLNHKLKKACNDLLEKSDKAFDFGYSIESNPSSSDLKKYLSMLRSCQKQKKVVLALIKTSKHKDKRGHMHDQAVYGVKLTQTEKLSMLIDYLVAKEFEKTIPVFPDVPKKPKIPKSLKLVKGKYEKIDAFKKRVALQKHEREKTIEKLKAEYEVNVKAYNSKVKELKEQYYILHERQQKEMPNIVSNAMKQAYATVYGRPYLDEDLKYDTENEIFYGFVKAVNGGFKERVAIKVPISEAEDFENGLDKLKTEVIFDYRNKKLLLKRVVIKKGEKKYLTMLNDVDYKSQNIAVNIDGGNFTFPVSPIINSSLDVDMDIYDIGSVTYSKDPEIARLQREKFKLERKVAEKRQSKKIEAELKRQKEALEVQIALLRQQNAGEDDIAKLLEGSKAHRIDKTKWLFIIAIENYDFTDPVIYSAHSARQFKKVMKKRLGIPEKNIRTLINNGATSGKINHHLKDMLRHVKKGDTIYFYYSGHGVPVASQANTPYLLAQDMSPDYVIDEPKFKLQNIYRSLSDSKASKIIVIIDSCFSGGADNQQLFKGVAASRLIPKKVTFDHNKMLVISAGSRTQYSNKYDEKSKRLFNYYIRGGLIKNNTNPRRVYD